MQPLRLLVFAANDELSACSPLRDITAEGSLFTYISLKEARHIADAADDPSGGPFGSTIFIYITCDEPCKPHLIAHLRGLAAPETEANEIRVGR